MSSLKGSARRLIRTTTNARDTDPSITFLSREDFDLEPASLKPAVDPAGNVEYWPTKFSDGPIERRPFVDVGPHLLNLITCLGE